MEDRFKRFVWLISVSAILIFGVSSIWSYYQSQTWQELVSDYHTNLTNSISKCELDPSSFHCNAANTYQVGFDSSVRSRDYYRDNLSISLIALISVPAISIILFFSIRWVITGKKPFFRKK